MPQLLALALETIATRNRGRFRKNNRRLAARDRLLARQEELANARAILAAFAEKWEFLAKVAAPMTNFRELWSNARR